MRTSLTSRTDAVSLPVTDSGGAAATSPPGDAAGALEAERVAVDGVAADPSVLDASPKPSYRDGVESHGKEVCTCNPSWVLHVLCPVHGYQSARDEHRRRARLSLWQAQR